MPNREASLQVRQVLVVARRTYSVSLSFSWSG